MDFLGLIIDFLSRLLLGPQGMDINTAIAPIVAMLIAAGVSAAATAGSSAIAAKKNKDNQKELDNMRLQSNNEYLREYYKGLGSTENRAYIKQLDNRMKKADTAAENSNVATNATHENALATKQKNNEVYDDAIAGMAARTSAQAERSRDNWFNRNYNLAGKQVEINNQTAQNWMNAASGISQAATSLGMSYAMDGGSLFGGNAGAGNAGAPTATQAAKFNNMQKNPAPRLNQSLSPDVYGMMGTTKNALGVLNTKYPFI